MAGLGVGASASGVRLEVPEETGNRFIKRTGVVLRRGDRMEGDVSVTLFLKSSGTVSVYVPGASKGSHRFGGTLEPFVWGHWQLYRSRNRTYLRETEVTDDLWKMRKNPRAVFRAVAMANMLSRSLIPGYPYDALLANFYWALKALENNAPPVAVYARFLWRWLLDWGIAPDLGHCAKCGEPLSLAAWRDGAFMCPRCAGFSEDAAVDAGTVFDISDFARYALSRSFVPDCTTDGLLRQSALISPFLKRNLELYR